MTSKNNKSEFQLEGLDCIKELSDAEAETVAGGVSANVRSTGGELLTNCKFYLEIDGIDQLRIFNIGGSDITHLAAGGSNLVGSGVGGQKLRQATPTNERFTKVTVKLTATENVELWDWYKQCNDSNAGRSQWQQGRRLASVIAYDQAGEVQAQWDMLNAYPSKYEGPNFQGGDDGMANESLEIVHKAVRRVR